MSLQKTIDCDSITLRTIYAKTQDNQNIPLNYTLITDGQGGTVWSTISTAGIATSFRSITVGAKQYSAEQTGYGLGITAGPGIGFLTSAPSSFGIYATGFQNVQVAGGNRLQSFSNTLYPTLNVEGTGGISVVANPDTQTLTFRAAGPSAISTGLYSYATFNIYSNVSSIQPSTISSLLEATQFTALSPSSSMKFVGLGDILLTTDYTNQGIYFGISSFTSEGYNQLQSTVSTLFSRTLSTVSTLFTDTYTYSTGTSSIRGSLSNLSSSTKTSIDAVYTALIGFTTVPTTNALSTSIGVPLSTTRGQVAILNSLSSVLYFKTSTLGASATVPMFGALGCDPTQLPSQVFSWSSAVFSVPMFSGVPAGSVVEFTYSPSFFFSTSTSNVQTIVNSVLYNPNAALNTTFSRPIQLLNFTSNLYTDTIRFSLTGTEAAACASAPFRILHTLTNPTNGLVSSLIQSGMSTNVLWFRVENPQQ